MKISTRIRQSTNEFYSCMQMGSIQNEVRIAISLFEGCKKAMVYILVCDIYTYNLLNVSS